VEPIRGYGTTMTVNGQTFRVASISTSLGADTGTLDAQLERARKKLDEFRARMETVTFTLHYDAPCCPRMPWHWSKVWGRFLDELRGIADERCHRSYYTHRWWPN
jgi:hypothetical protein